MIKCQDCGVDIHPEAFHTGHEKWCEDCFDKGLCKDMNDHWNPYWEQELTINIIEET
jgi:hypothetical protein